MLLVNANLVYAPAPFSWFPFKFDYVDFTQNWFYDIAPSLIKMMISIGLIPWVEFVFQWLISAVKRLWDSGTISYHKVTSTKCTTLKHFINLYGGPTYQIHFRFASIMTLVSISFMYGMAIPMMIPVTFLGLISIYVNERILLAYFYQKPTCLDSEIEKMSYSFFSFAPVPMFIIGYWCMSNR